MKAHDRDVGGIRCFEVLEKLSAYLDGELGPEDVDRINKHLEGCSWCERFGGHFAAVVTALRLHMQDAGPLAPIVRKRLRECLPDRTATSAESG